MKHRASASNLYFRFLPIACALFPTLTLLSGCGGAAQSDGVGIPGGSSAGTGSQAGSGSAGAASGSSAGAVNGGSGSVGASCMVGDKTYASGTEGFLGPDGCNHCSCSDGQLACTDMACNLPLPKPCGGLINLPCGEEEYCQHPVGECGVTAGGQCSRIPDGCTGNYDPVCGCDGKVHSNACSAAAAGVSVAHTGACDAVLPGSCSVTPDGQRYADGATDIPAGDGCNVCTCTNGALQCTDRPCKAPTPCGARAGDSCAASEYCAYTPGLACGDGDAEARCKPRPSACSTLDQPVCGCDGKSYINACSAALAGSGVSHAGGCTVR